MKISKYIKTLAALLFGTSALTGCQDKFDDVAVEVPVATQTANISIADFKAAFWQDEASNYCDEIPAREDGTHYIIKGRVISSDYAGNVFKKLIICDGTAALAMSINQYNLYLTHRVGQELVIDLTGMYAGKYAGCFQLGFPSWYANGNTWQTSFMAPELFNSHCELNGLPETDAPEVQPVVIENFSSIGSSPAELQQWQSRLVRLNNVKFANAGVEGEMLCANYKTSVSAEQNQALNVGDTQLTVRTSGYSNFWNTPLPASEFDIVGILDYYNGNWQLILNDVEGLMNIGNPTNKGSQNDPYSVTEAAALIASGTSASGWVSGYIVGTLAPEVTEVKTLADIWTTEPFIMNNSVVIVPDVDNYTLDDILLVNLPQGTPLAEYVNLVDNENLGKQLKIQGRFAKDMGLNAVINTTGAVSTFEIEGLEIEDPNAPVESGDGTEEKPYNVTQVISLGNPGTKAWVEGYIVGYYDYDNNSALVNAAGSVNSCVALAADPNETDKNKTVAVQLPVGDIRTAVNLADHPENLGKKLAIQGSLVKYFGLPGVKDATAYKLNGEGSGSGSGSGNETPSTPTEGATGDGTKASPYNCAAVIGLNNPGTKAWVKGYIVGVYNYDNNSALESTPGTVNTCVALADNPNETDKNKTVAVQLPVGDIRTAVNLVDHPENLGKLLAIEGELVKYFGLPGVKNATAYELEGAGNGGNSGDDQPVTPPSADTTGDGTEAKPYDVADIIALNCLDGSIVGWTEGYIVGSLVNSAPVFGTEGAAATNLILAPSASETDYNKCIPVELPSGAIRKALNLQDNPGNLGKKIEINATLTKYFSRAGLKKPTAYK